MCDQLWLGLQYGFLCEFMTVWSVVCVVNGCFSHTHILCLFLCVGKKRRLTIIECGNDMNTMIDVAKVADLVSVCVKISFTTYIA